MHSSVFSVSSISYYLITVFDGDHTLADLTSENNRADLKKEFKDSYLIYKVYMMFLCPLTTEI